MAIHTANWHLSTGLVRIGWDQPRLMAELLDLVKTHTVISITASQRKHNSVTSLDFNYVKPCLDLL